MSAWKGPGGACARPHLPLQCHFGLNPTPRGELEPSPRSLPVIKVLVTFKASRRDPHCQGTFSEAQYCDILDLEIPRQMCLT